MEIYLLRHGDAVEPNMWGMKPDAERPLTEDGISKLEKAALGMERMGLAFDRIISSPYVRANETARIVAKGLDHSDKIELCDALCPDATYADFVKIVSKLVSKKSVLFVGHQPSIGGFLSRLIGGAKGASLEFKKGALARVDVADGSAALSGELKWFLTQKHLRSIA